MRDPAAQKRAYEKYYNKNRSLILQKKKEYYLAKRESELARSNAWREFNLEYKQEYDRKRYLAKKQLQNSNKEIIVTFDD